MGSPSNEVGRYYNNENQHEVTLTKPFYIGVFEVTQKQWENLMWEWPSYFSNPTCKATRPVENVSYDRIRGSQNGAKWPESNEVDGDSFIGRLRSKTGLEFDLPTEAQWEYACRAGTTTALNSGQNVTTRYSVYPCPNMAVVGRYSFNQVTNSPNCDTSGGTAAVGSYQPNAWGLYDMHGHVYEWCLDYSSLRVNDTKPVIDPKGETNGTSRSFRGGAWNSPAFACRSAARTAGGGPNQKFSRTGFRLCCPAGDP